MAMFTESKAKGADEQPEKPSFSGLLVVITGASGVGKDSVTEGLISHRCLVSKNFKRLITCADRAPRPGEIEGTHYFFVSPEKLTEMHNNGELVETPQATGSSRKGTPKREVLKVLSGENKVWRIDPTLASKVATGEFFDEQFPGEIGKALRERTVVICVTASPDALARRRRQREGKNYDTDEFKLRDEQEKPLLETLASSAIIVENKQDLLEDAVEQVISLLHL